MSLTFQVEPFAAMERFAPAAKKVGVGINADTQTFWLTVKEHDTVIGGLGFKVWGKHLLIRGVWIEPWHRGRGLSRLLIDAVEQIAPMSEDLYMRTYHPAWAESLGFSRTGKTWKMGGGLHEVTRPIDR